MRYLGSSTATVVVYDDLQLLNLNVMDPGDEIVISGVLSNNNFVGDKVRIFVDGSLHATIYTNCNGGIFVGVSFGDFVVIGATSQYGGTICCATNTIEKTGPTFVGCPANVNVTTTTGQCSRSVSWTPPTVIDNCDVVSLTSTHDPGSTFPVGSTVVTYSATDGNGNTTLCSFTVQVKESIPPTIVGCPEDIFVNGDASCEAVVSWTPPATSDNCSEVNLTSTHAPGSSFTTGNTTVTYTATDLSGNSSTCSFIVSVIDPTPEAILGDCPNDILVKSIGKGVATWTPPTFGGECAGYELTSNHAPGDMFDVGDTQVTYKASNGDYELSCSFTVTVIPLQLVIHEILTPNGDDANETWVIENIEHYHQTSVVVFDRWGSVVYRAEDYNNTTVAWDGGKLPTGTYFYRVSARLDNTVTNETGFIELVR